MKRYKLKSEIRAFILKKTQECPELGCRKISLLIQEEFKINLSKSTISTVLKAEGLNKSIGRRRVKKKDTTSQVLGLKSQVAGKEETLLFVSDGRPALLTSADKSPQVIQPLPIEPKDKIIILPEPQSELPTTVAILDAPETETSFPNVGCWFLKAAELCLGGIKAISEILAPIINIEKTDLIAENEILLYLPLFGAEDFQDLDSASRESLSFLTGGKEPEETPQRLPFPNLVGSCGLEQAKSALPRIFSELVSCQSEVLALKFILEDNSFFFLDAGWHSIWSTNHIPLYFGAGLHRVREFLHYSILFNANPLILQAPPGFDIPITAFLNFIAAFQSAQPEKTIQRIELYSLDNQLMDTIPMPQKKRYFIFGLWPWQYKNRDKDIVQQLRGRSEAPDKAISSRLLCSLRSFAMTERGNRKVLDIISNLEEEKYDDKAIIRQYSARWPNLELGYQDFLDKIGHFHRVARTRLASKNNVQFPKDKDITLSMLLAYWRQRINLYCQKHFFPLNYQDGDFLFLKEQFYHLRGKVNAGGNTLRIIFEPEKDFLYLKDLHYACQKVNEADIHLRDGRKLSFETK